MVEGLDRHGIPFREAGKRAQAAPCVQGENVTNGEADEDVVIGIDPRELLVTGTALTVLRGRRGEATVSSLIMVMSPED